MDRDLSANTNTTPQQIWSLLGHYNHNIASIKVNNSNFNPSPITTTAEVTDANPILSISIADENNTQNQFANTPNATHHTITWGDNGAALHTHTTPTTLNLSSNVNSEISTAVSYTATTRIWKLIQVGEDAPRLKLRIPQDIINNNSTTGSYYMLVSDSDTFDSNLDFRMMTLNDNAYLETDYNFNNTSYITFVFSPQISEERSIYFNGSDSYIDMQNTLDLNPTGFTISAWINHDATNFDDVSILSKRDVAFTKGYDLVLTTHNKIKITWNNGSSQSLISQTSIPENQWHHIAVSYNDSQVSIYIDGVLDNSADRTAPTLSNASFLIAAAGKNAPTQYFKGHIDEVQIWNTSLTKAQLRFIMNQEITNDSGRVIGKELPISIDKNDISTMVWSDLAAYYPMTNFTIKNTIDASGNNNDGELKHILSVDTETAPLPYISEQGGYWNDHTTWKNGNLQYIPGATSIVDPNVTIDWNIVKTSHSLKMDNWDLPPTKNNNRTVLGLFVKDEELKLIGETANHTGNGLTITHYLELTGKIDLEGESQLVQTLGSDLDVFSNGAIERDQQGTSDTYTYNYWSSPVTRQNSESINFRVMDVLKDGTDPHTPSTINFSSSGYNGAPTNPITIADYWIWKFTNLPSNTYSAWQHIRRTGTMLPGEGFTMKGPGSGSISTPQNYVFSGKPNNGDINLNLVANSDYLVGNPYPSAIDALQFIRDNGPDVNSNSSPLISGTLYFWNHWGGGSHALQDYEGGYATFNFSGGVAAAYKGNNYAILETDGEPKKAPGRYIPIGQGFFVMGQNSGRINFNNGQRIFKKESNSSVFMRSTNSTTVDNSDANSSEDNRMKFRIGFNSVNTIKRQLLLTIDENTTSGVDWGYDGLLNEQQIDDMFWLINDETYLIQASNESDTSSTYPIGIKTKTDGINSIMIDDLEHVPNDMNVYLHDNELNLYHDLRTSNYNIFLTKGEYLNRFEITFGTQEDQLNIDAPLKNPIDVLYSNAIKKIVILNPNSIDLESMTIFNMLGQSIFTLNRFLQNNYSEYDIKNLNVGTYVAKLKTGTGSVVSKKITVN
ncbi:LamG-like jellyroll fold domain-containing protein [Winogradskyella sp. PC D3.3]